MVPMRMVSACACARDQSRLRTAAVAAEFFSSVLREVAMAIPPEVTSFYDCRFCFLESIQRMPEKVNNRLNSPPSTIAGVGRDIRPQVVAVRIVALRIVALQKQRARLATRPSLSHCAGLLRVFPGGFRQGHRALG